MKRSLIPGPRRGLALLLPLLAAACTDSSPVAPTPEPQVEGLAALECTVHVQSGSMSCAAVEPAAGSGVRLNRIVGGQNRNVRLSNSNNLYDAGTQTFQTDVTIQNLTQQLLGTPDGTTPTGIMVFLVSDPVTVTPGTVSVMNSTGHAFVTAPNQAYFMYNEILRPNEISEPMTWQFSVPSASTSFSFTVLVQAEQPDELMTFTDKVWDGSKNTDWSDTANWENGAAPDSGGSVLIPAGVPNMPVLAADVQITHLSVNSGATLSLGTFTLTAWGNVDALGPITTGTLWMRGSGVVTGGNLPSVILNGGTMLQRSTTTSGAVSISDGSLVVDGSKPLSISIP